jgi:hypothetical protein
MFELRTAWLKRTTRERLRSRPCIPSAHANLHVTLFRSINTGSSLSCLCVSSAAGEGEFVKSFDICTWIETSSRSSNIEWELSAWGCIQMLR